MVRSARAGKQYLSRELMKLLIRNQSAVSHRREELHPLAPRECEILRKIAKGQSTRSIAVELGVGVKTIETHRRRIMAKLNRHSVAELTQYAVKEELISLENSA